MNGTMDDSLVAHMTAVQKYCRFCLLDCSPTMVNIFQETPAESPSSTSIPLVKRLYEVFQIKYEKSALLPNKICHKCLNLIESCCAFRERLLTFENELQIRYKALNGKDSEPVRPGLNGLPGDFVPDNESEIVEVKGYDEEEDEEDDDFSMESDSEIDIHNSTASSMPEHQIRLLAKEKGANSASASKPQEDAVQKQPVQTDKRGPANIVSAPNTQGGAGPDLIARNTYLCQYCDIAFTTQSECNDHEAKHDPNEPYSCILCDYRTANRQTHIQHVREQHKQERPYVCVICKKGFSRRSDLKKHTIVHTGVRPFVCHICTKSFSRNTNLTKHIRIHTGANATASIAINPISKPFPCTICAAAFTRRDKLVAHLNAVHNKPISDVGGTGTVSSEISNEEQLRASSSASVNIPTKPSGAVNKQGYHSRGGFTCNVCAKSFTRERDLQRHRAIHMDALFACKQCGASFNRRVKLLKHEQENHATQYPCEFCSVVFYDKAVLEKHLKAHELQQNSTNNAFNAVATVGATSSLSSLPQPVAVPVAASREGNRQADSAAELSFYSQMLPTMNLGFYSETRPEDA